MVSLGISTPNTSEAQRFRSRVRTWPPLSRSILSLGVPVRPGCADPDRVHLFEKDWQRGYAEPCSATIEGIDSNLNSTGPGGTSHCDRGSSSDYKHRFSYSPQTSEERPETGGLTGFGLAARGLALVMDGWHRYVSPWLPPACRFEPTCSRYFALAVRRHGIVKGSILGLRRLARCHPWNPGGKDPVP